MPEERKEQQMTNRAGLEGRGLEFKSLAPRTKLVAVARFLFNCKFPQVKRWLLVSLLLGWREAM